MFVSEFGADVAPGRPESILVCEMMLVELLLRVQGTVLCSQLVAPIVRGCGGPGGPIRQARRRQTCAFEYHWWWTSAIP